MRRISPDLSMLGVRLDGPLEDWIIIIVQGGRCLSHSRSALNWTNQLIICAGSIELAPAVKGEALKMVDENEENDEKENAGRAKNSS